MRSRAAYLLAFPVLLLLPAAPIRAEGLPPLPTLRHLVFSANVSISDDYQNKLDNIPQGGTSIARGAHGTGGSIVTGNLGSTTAHSKTRTNAETRIVCDVVAATEDGGLVVDVREDGADRRSPIVRVAVQANGRMSYSPGRTLNAEEVAVLQLLARGVIGPEVRETGATWSIEANGGDYHSKMVFRVTGLPTPDVVELDVNQEFRSGGSQSYAGGMHGKVLYDPTRLVPRKAVLASITRIETPQTYRVVDLSIDLALVEDTFAKR